MFKNMLKKLLSKMLRNVFKPLNTLNLFSLNIFEMYLEHV